MQASIGARHRKPRWLGGGRGGTWLAGRLLGLGLVLLAAAIVAPSQASAQSATTTTVSSSLNPATFPQSETFTATVTSTSTVSESTVTFQSDANTIAGCGAQPVSNGTATCTTQLAAGSHPVVAIFNGDVNFLGSLSSTLTQVVNPAVTATQHIATLTFSQGANGNSAQPPVLGGGGTGSLTYSVSPTLPSGVSINPSTGVVSGQPSVTHATSTFTVTVTDANSQTASNTFQLTDNPAIATTVAIGSVALTQNRTPTPFVPVTSTGGTAPISYAISPPLLTGLSFDSTTGTVSGTPSVTHATSSFMVTATDFWGGTASSNFSLTVNPAVTATQSVPSATLTQNHAATPFTPVTGSGGTGALSYAVSPPLPTGLSISSTTGAVSGTPSVTSSATTYTVTVTDQDGATATNTFNLTVNTQVTATQQVSAAFVTQNHAVTPFTPVTGAGGTGTLTYGVSPPLPSGLSLSTSTGSVTGTPTATAAQQTYTVTVTDQDGATATNTFNLTVNGPVAATTQIASKGLTINIAATPFTPVTGSGGAGTLSYSVSPTLPAGLAMASSTGTITGLPTAISASSSYTVTVTDQNGATATASFSLAVNGAVTASTAIPSTTLTVNRAASSFTPVTGGGGSTPYAYSVARRACRPGSPWRAPPAPSRARRPPSARARPIP